MMLHQSGSPDRISGMILQKAFGYRPLSIFLIALCTSSFSADTPRWLYFIRSIFETKILHRTGYPKSNPVLLDIFLIGAIGLKSGDRSFSGLYPSHPSPSTLPW